MKKKATSSVIFQFSTRKCENRKCQTMRDCFVHILTPFHRSDVYAPEYTFQETSRHHNKTLRKLQLQQQRTKAYIASDDDSYAI